MQSQAEQEAWSRKVAVVVVVVAVWATTGLPPIGLVAAAEPAGIVYLVQGLPNGSVDLAIDGRTVAVAARPGVVVGPLKVPSGTRRPTARVDGELLLGSAFRPGPASFVSVSSWSSYSNPCHLRRIG